MAEMDAQGLYDGTLTQEEVDDGFNGWALLIWGALAAFTSNVFSGRGYSGLIESQGFNIDQAVDSARLTYASSLTKINSEKEKSTTSILPGELDPTRSVQAGSVRPTFTSLGGGGLGAEAALLGSPTAGTVFANWMSENGISTSGKIWVYGAGNRRPFTGHLVLDGMVFDSFTDDVLAVSSQDAWIRRSHYTPGDHAGCSCVVSPYIPNWI